MAATKTIPIVIVAGAPLQSGFIKSLSEPGGNVTGLSGMDAELGGKRVQVLRELIPNLNCVGVLATTPHHRSVQPAIRGGHSGSGQSREPPSIAGPNRWFERA